MVQTERELVGLALALGVRNTPGLSSGEAALASEAVTVSDATIQAARDAILAGRDPLGEALCRLRSPVARRPMGATYTPSAIISAMTEWASCKQPVRVVDPGAGSGRFLVAAGHRFPTAQLVGVELDPLAALLLRANLAVNGLTQRARVTVEDFRLTKLPEVKGSTLFIGNPPYVRHHLIEPHWKAWLVSSARALGLEASQLAGLHLYFFLATALQGKVGDYGSLITAAEWLDVNYGNLLRKLFLGALGGRAIHLIEPTVAPFADADTTAAITCFEIGTRAPSVRLRRVESLSQLSPMAGGRQVRRERLDATQRWSPLTRPAKKGPAGFVELGELCQVHRGQVTGANKVWIAGTHSAGLPDCVLFPTVTRARELFSAGIALSDAGPLKRVIDLPVDLDSLPDHARPSVDRFLRIARSMGADQGFIARHRKAWWAVELRKPAPILATYMARRPPAFVRNLAAVRHINIAHGIYPRDAMTQSMLSALAKHLNERTTTDAGRTYAGGLTKFEPKEMERILVPGPELLAATNNGEEH